MTATSGNFTGRTIELNDVPRGSLVDLHSKPLLRIVTTGGGWQTPSGRTGATEWPSSSGLEVTVLATGLSEGECRMLSGMSDEAARAWAADRAKARADTSYGWESLMSGPCPDGRWMLEARDPMSKTGAWRVRWPNGTTTPISPPSQESAALESLLAVPPGGLSERVLEETRASIGETPQSPVEYIRTLHDTIRALTGAKTCTASQPTGGASQATLEPDPEAALDRIMNERRQAGRVPVPARRRALPAQAANASTWHNVITINDGTGKEWQIEATRTGEALRLRWPGGAVTELRDPSADEPRYLDAA